MPVTVKWGRDAFQFELPAPDTVLGAIRHSIAAYTQLPYAAFTLVHDGAPMTDDNAPISLYHLRPNSTIAIVQESTQPAPSRNTEAAQIATIHAELAAVQNTLRPAHAQLIHDLTPHTRPSLAKERSRIAELLLQALLRVDGIVPERDWSNARAQRKAAVRELQSLLDQLDSAWADTA